MYKKSGDRRASRKPLKAAGILRGKMAGTTGLEPATSAVTGQRSNQLNYVPRVKRATSDDGRSRN